MTDAAVTSAPAAPSATGSAPNANASPGGQPNAEAQPEIPEWKKQKHRYKSNGQEVEVDYDELVKRAQKADGLDKRLAEVAKTEKEIKARLEKLKDPQADDFNELIELIGFDKAKKFADKLVWDSLQWDELPDHEKQRRIAQHRAETAEQKLQRLEDERAEAQQQQMNQQAMQVIDKEISDVLAAAKKEGMPIADNPAVTEMIIDEMLAYLQYVETEEAAGRPIRNSPPTHMDVLRKIQDRENNRSSAYMKHLSVEQLMSVLSKEQLAALRQAEIDQLYAPTRGNGRAQKQGFDQSPQQRSSKTQQKLKTEDYFKKMDERYRG